ncbi:hypothetical protein J3R83DRAFT_4663 [Lanmaoa asiatica]|nr:hypothetical protein J3R83DRAFT_4663 [Lanmaoa asiatica]
MILEHSFCLYQQKYLDLYLVISSAAQKYKASDSHGRVEKALEEVFKEYGKASENQKVDMVTNVILQHHMYVLDSPFNILSVYSYAQYLHQLDQVTGLSMVENPKGEVGQKKGRKTGSKGLLEMVQNLW